MTYTLNIDGDEFIPNPTAADISEAIAKVGRGVSNFFIVLKDDCENVFMQTGYPETPDGEWNLEHRDDTEAQYSRPVHVDSLVSVISQWMGLSPGWAPGPEWQPLEEDEDPGPEFDSAIGTDWIEWVVREEGDSLALIYVDDNGQPIPKAHLIPDVDLLTKITGTTFTRLADGQTLMLRPLLTEQSRHVIDEIVAHPDYQGYNWPKFALEHDIDAEVPEHEAQFDFNPAISKVYSRRVGRTLVKRAKVIAKAVLADPSFDPLDDELQEGLVAKHASDAPMRLLKAAQSAVTDMSSNLREKAERDIAKQAKIFVSSLTPSEVDRLALLTGSQRSEELVAAHPHLSPGRARLLYRPAQDLLSETWRERDLRFATVSRALLAVGKTKSELAALFRISQAKVSTTMNDAPEDIRLAEDDHLRQLVVGMVELNETLPSAQKVLEARKNAAKDAAAEAAAFGNQFEKLTADLIASWPRRTIDQFALLPYKDREQLLAEQHPELAPVVVTSLASHVTSAVWRIDTDERVARYATAIRAIQAKGSSRAAAARYLGIGAAWAGDVLSRKADDVDLTDDDYLVALVRAYKR